MESRRKSLIGQRFCRLMVIADAPWNGVCSSSVVQCDCGQTKVVTNNNLKQGGVKSCGCFAIHGHARIGKKSLTYQVWHQMRQRCLNPKNKGFQNYGGRGITVCDRWSDFKLFLEDMGEKPAGLSIDRINNDQGYCKENCRWTTHQVQMNNTRHNRLLSFNGKRMNATQWGTELGMNRDVILQRLDYGWTDERTLSTPIKANLEKWRIRYDGQLFSLNDFAKHVSVSSTNISIMLTRIGWPRGRVVALKQVPYSRGRKRFVPCE